jgi:hypothetical protein
MQIVRHACEHMNRRKFVATVCGLALSADAASLPAGTSNRNKTASLLGKLKTASFHKKIELLQTLYEGVAFHESGIIYSMQRLDVDGIRPFVASDFDGQIGINPSVAKLQLNSRGIICMGKTPLAHPACTWRHSRFASR